jgi:hypothetical protein
MRVWKDGERQPIEELSSVNFTEGSTELVGIGGIELYNRVQKNINFEESHVVAENLVSNNTSYVTNFDTPNSETFWTAVQEVSDDSAAVYTETGEEDFPIFYGQPTVTHLETAEVEYAEDASADGTTISDSKATQGTAQAITNFGESIVDFVILGDTQPADTMEPAIRVKSPTSNPPGFTIELEGTKVYEIASGGFFTSDTGYHWITSADFNDSPEYPDETQTYEVKIEIDSSTGDELHVDLIGIHDGRVPHNFDNTLDANDELAGPEPYTNEIDCVFKTVSTGFRATEARIDSSWDDTSNNQSLAISSDNGSTWNEATNTETHSVNFNSLTQTVKGRITLSNYGTKSTTPTNGINAQDLDSWKLEAKLDDTPILSERSFDDRLINVMKTIADEGNFIWEVQWDNANSQISIEWTQPGQRTSTEDAGIIQYKVDKQTRDLVEKATVFGSAQTRREVDFFSFSSESYDNIADDHIVEGSEVVYDSSGDEYERGVDYEIDYLNGRIKTLNGGSAPVDTMFVDYRYKAYASYDNGTANPREQVYDNTSLNNDGLCTVAAKIIVDRAGDPLWEADVIIPKQPVGWNVIDKVNPEELPSTENLQIRDIIETPEKLVLRMASRRSAGEIISDIQSIASKNARKV